MPNLTSNNNFLVSIATLINKNIDLINIIQQLCNSYIMNKNIKIVRYKNIILIICKL